MSPKPEFPVQNEALDEDCFDLEFEDLHEYLFEQPELPVIKEDWE